MQREPARSDTTFYIVMAVVSAVLLFLGFAPSFYLRGVIPAPVPPLSPLTLTHGLVYTAWMVLFIVQTALIGIGRPAIHRQLGMMLAILFGAMVALGISTAVTAGRLGHIPPGAPPPLAFMALPLLGMVSTVALVGAALLYRRQSDWHKRLMIAGLFTLTGPGTGRIAIPLGLAPHSTTIALTMIEGLLAICILYDVVRHRRLHPAYGVAAVVVVATHIAVVWAFSSPLWLAFAHWLTRS